MLTLAVLVGCVVASVWAWSGDTEVIWRRWSLRPYYMKHYHEWYRALTSVFFHADWAHLAVNLFVFYSFGQQMERYYGREVYTALLLVGAAGSALITYLLYADNPYHLSIGLSGVVNAVVFAFILHNPKATLLVFLLLPLPAWLFALLYLAYSFYEAQRGRGLVNHWAHIGGAIAGIFFAAFLR